MPTIRLHHGWELRLSLTHRHPLLFYITQRHTIDAERMGKCRFFRLFSSTKKKTLRQIVFLFFSFFSSSHFLWLELSCWLLLQVSLVKRESWHPPAKRERENRHTHTHTRSHSFNSQNYKTQVVCVFHSIELLYIKKESILSRLLIFIWFFIPNNHVKEKEKKSTNFQPGSAAW